MNKAFTIAAALSAAAFIPNAASAATTFDPIGTNGDWSIEGPGGASELVTFTPANASIPDSWSRDPSNGVWISPTANPRTQTSPAGLYTFVGVFSLANIQNVQTWNVTWWADNVVRNIIVNGTSLYTGTGGSLSQEFVNGGISRVFNNPVWVNGQNRVTFVVENGAGASGNPTGLRVGGFVSSVPEPGTWMLMILGLGAVGFAMRRRQNTAVRLQFA